jgi:hypothetical protein
MEFDKHSDNVMKNWETYGFIQKDVSNGDILKVKNIQFI